MQQTGYRGSDLKVADFKLANNHGVFGIAMVLSILSKFFGSGVCFLCF